VSADRYTPARARDLWATCARDALSLLSAVRFHAERDPSPEADDAIELCRQAALACRRVRDLAASKVAKKRANAPEVTP
jgi:hypothetical protein